jgi:GR25 family glycosyltransferase involved in LPS biosynthesis
VIRFDAKTPHDLDGYNFYPTMSLPERACGLSHYLLWKKIVDERLPYALILEDDACFRKDWQTITNPFLQEVSTRDPVWDCILLNAYDPVSPLETWVPTQGNCCAAAYILSLHGALQMVLWSQRCILASDWMTLRLQQQGHTYSYFPWLVIQEGQDTYIQFAKQGEDRKKVERLLMEANYSLNNYI